ncbi:NHS-like protein 1 isoform X3 [Lates japonicus]|uniref:NHS-like protein 1 isoform X3 n=1 Tax=Lates japonicus TaxID=270547 RepID=A0AAD3RIT3_LATJO|nr:NHS-like protein 1 isoform X3 [Lates japonicus]
MRGDRRSASFRKEKPPGLSRALSWLSVSTLSRQSRRIFHSQSELHAVHHRHAYSHSHSHTHLHAADGDEDDDDDNWVYQPQHKIGESGTKGRKKERGKRNDDTSCVAGY